MPGCCRLHPAFHPSYRVCRDVQLWYHQPSLAETPLVSLEIACPQNGRWVLFMWQSGLCGCFSHLNIVVEPHRAWSEFESTKRDPFVLAPTKAVATWYTHLCIPDRGHKTCIPGVPKLTGRNTITNNLCSRNLGPFAFEPRKTLQSQSYALRP